MTTSDLPATAIGDRDELRSISVGGQQLRVAVRRGDGTRVPLLLCNGIGASLDLLQPFVDELDPSLDVIRFDVPGVGGSPLPALPYRFGGLSRAGRPDARHARLRCRRRARDLLGRRAGAALRVRAAPPLPAAGAGRHRRPARSWCPPRPGCWLRWSPRGATWTPRTCEQIAPLPVRRDRPHRPGPGDRADARADQGRVPARLPLPARAGAGWTSLPFLPLLRQPTLIMAGDDDPIIPLANATLLRFLIPNAGCTSTPAGT